jgi:hypothetical protein
MGRWSSAESHALQVVLERIELGLAASTMRSSIHWHGYVSHRGCPDCHNRDMKIFPKRLVVDLERPAPNFSNTELDGAREGFSPYS